jgi:hypothetical protein
MRNGMSREETMAKATETRVNRREVKITSLTGWELVCLFNHGRSVVLNMAKEVQGQIMDRVWAIQDGYGEPGFTPAQGWDWSGIRDSSDLAKVKMAFAILAILHNFEFTTLTVEDREYKFEKVEA